MPHTIRINTTFIGSYVFDISVSTYVVVPIVLLPTPELSIHPFPDGKLKTDNFHVTSYPLALTNYL